MKAPHNPDRWVDGGHRPGSKAELAARLVTDLPQPVDPTAADLARIWEGLDQRRQRARRLWLPRVVVASLLLATATGGAAALVARRRAAQPTATPHRPAPADGAAWSGPPPAITPKARPADPAPARRGNRTATSRSPRAVRPVVATDAAAPPSALARETTLLAAALAALRQGHDPRAALIALDRYDQEFPAGSLAHEAAAARVDALLEAGQRDAALALLDRLPLRDLPRSLERQLIRGELRAAAGRCPDALGDFAAVLRALPSAVLSARARRGQALCAGGPSSRP